LDLNEKSESSDFRKSDGRQVNRVFTRHIYSRSFVAVSTNVEFYYALYYTLWSRKWCCSVCLFTSLRKYPFHIMILALTEKQIVSLNK